jgi:hypothetical protein
MNVKKKPTLSSDKKNEKDQKKKKLSSALRANLLRRKQIELEAKSTK